jgi:hypothetical protein
MGGQRGFAGMDALVVHLQSFPSQEWHGRLRQSQRRAVDREFRAFSPARFVSYENVPGCSLSSKTYFTRVSKVRV